MPIAIKLQAEVDLNITGQEPSTWAGSAVRSKRALDVLQDNPLVYKLKKGRSRAARRLKRVQTGTNKAHSFEKGKSQIAPPIFLSAYCNIQRPRSCFIMPNLFLVTSSKSFHDLSPSIPPSGIAEAY
jgi:hypothetical protein